MLGQNFHRLFRTVDAVGKQFTECTETLTEFRQTPPPPIKPKSGLLCETLLRPHLGANLVKETY